MLNSVFYTYYKVLAKLFFPLQCLCHTCGNLKRRAGFAPTLRSLCKRLHSVGVSTPQVVQRAAAVAGGAAGRRVPEAGGRVDGDAPRSILVFNPGDQDLVGRTVQGVVLDHRRAGG